MQQSLTIDNGQYGRIVVDPSDESVDVTISVSLDGRGGHVLLSRENIEDLIAALQEVVS